MISENLADVRAKIAGAAKRRNRHPGDITLICVTKGRSLEEIREVIRCGIVEIGENKVQEAISKYKDLKPITYNLTPIKWHMVGHLQTNKVKDAVKIFDLIHSVDSLRLAEEINKQAAKINKIQDILIEVNTSGEETKFGVKPEKLLNLAKGIINLKNARLLGLMTMAPIVKNKEDARPYFQRLRQLKNEVNIFPSTINYKLSTVLSMGMSQDYEIAIEEGATIVRIGTAIFENTN